MMTTENLQQARRHALQLLQNNSIQVAKERLLVLANLNYAPAMTDLAMILLMDKSERSSAQSALEYLFRAEQLNYAPAIYQLASISITDSLLKLNWNELNHRLQRCCLLDDANALCDAALLLAHFGSKQQQLLSTSLLEMSAMKGSTVALALLGERLANGFLCQIDKARANSIKQLALSGGFPVSQPEIEYGFSPAESANISPVHLAELNLDTQQTDLSPSGRVIDDGIQLKQFPDFFAEEECLYICCMGGPFIKPSVTVDEQGQTHQNQIRTSFEFMFEIENESIYLKLLQRRLAKATNLPLENAEQLILLRYTPGQEYKPHRDYLPPSHFETVDAGGAGQRLKTVIAYLNTPELGGETAFLALNNQIKARQGQVICFDNMSKTGQLNEKSIHAGLPVQQGIKWICTLWLRQSSYRLL